jgi:hypothetical protein
VQPEGLRKFKISLHRVSNPLSSDLCSQVPKPLGYRVWCNMCRSQFMTLFELCSILNTDGRISGKYCVNVVFAGRYVVTFANI